MAKAWPSTIFCGRSFSLPTSLPNTNRPPGISTSGLSAMTSSSAAAAAAHMSAATARSHLEIDTFLTLAIEQEYPLGRKADLHHLIEVAHEVLVGADSEQGCSSANGDQRAF